MVNNRGQEEIVGFAIIVVIVSLIVIFFLVFSLSNRAETDSYEAESFLQSALQYTTSCEAGGDLLSLGKLIDSCDKEERCGNVKDACVVLNETAMDLLDVSWQVGPEAPVVGYDIKAYSSETPFWSLTKGNISNTEKSAQQVLSESGSGQGITVIFRAYQNPED